MKDYLNNWIVRMTMVCQAGQGVKNTFVIFSIKIIISDSNNVCMSYLFANFVFRLISCVTSQTIEQSGLGVKFLEHPLLERSWHCVNTHLDAPDKQTTKT